MAEGFMKGQAEKMKDLYIGGNAGWSAESAFHHMVENKKVWRKPDGTQAFHYILSFPPTEEITPETAISGRRNRRKDPRRIFRIR